MNTGLLLEEFFVHLIPSVTIVYIVIGIKFIRDNRVNYFSLIMFAAAVYSFVFFVEKVSTNGTLALLLRKASYPAAAYIPAFGLLFIMQLTYPHKIRIVLISLLYSISSVFGLLYLTNDRHKLFFTYEEFIYEGNFGTISAGRGPVFMLLASYFLISTTISGLLLIKKYRSVISLRVKKSFGMLFFITLIPWISIVFIVLEIERIDPIPFTIMIMMILLAVSEIRHGIFKGYLGMWKNSHNNFNIPSILVDSEFEVLVSNTAYDNLSRNTKMIALDKIRELIKTDRYKGEIYTQPADGGKYFEITQSAYNIKQKIYSIFISDITEIKRHQEEVNYLSFYDQLTGLQNRRYFESEIYKIDKEENIPICFVMIDVNGLKLTNDAFGHIAGDELLITLAKMLKDKFAENCSIARVGGDEFIITIPKTEISDVKERIEKFKEEIGKKKIRGIEMSIAVGISVKSDIDQHISDVIKEAEDQMYRNKLYEDLSMRSKIIDLIMNTLYEKNKREMLHSERVGDLSEKIALLMHISENEARQIKLAGKMHDIGKIGIDESILNDPKAHNKEKTSEMQKHSEIGYRLLSSVNEFSGIARYVLEHHEKWNGTGYPKGLAGEDISLPARIIAVADAFDAMTNDRPYRSALSPDEALIELTNYAGIQFDPDVIDALQRMPDAG